MSIFYFKKRPFIVMGLSNEKIYFNDSGLCNKYFNLFCKYFNLFYFRAFFLKFLIFIFRIL